MQSKLHNSYGTYNMNYIKLKRIYNLYSEYNLYLYLYLYLYTGRDTDYILFKADYITSMGHLI
jgi:hypothetical protein